MSDYYAAGEPDLPLFATRAPVGDRPRLNRQCLKILARLREGPATNRELAEIALNYRARTSDLRNAGYTIDCERKPGGKSIYTLKGEPRG